MKIFSILGGGKQEISIEPVFVEYEDKWVHFSDITDEEFRDNSYYQALFNPQKEIARIQELVDIPIYTLLHRWWFVIQYYDWEIENEVRDVKYADSTINRWPEWSSTLYVN